MASPAVKIYDPNLQVMLYKTISRTTLNGSNPTSQRFQGTSRTIDLTPYFGEGGSVRTTKSVREPAGGFALLFADQPFIGEYANQQTFETLYGLVEPMDYIEIRFRHNLPTSSTSAGVSTGSPVSAPSSKPPIIMRGFVSDIARSETMSSDGKPQRGVTITGQDYGKFWQMLQIMYLPGYVTGEDVLSGFKLFERYGGSVNTLTTAQFVTQIMQTVVNPFIANLMPANSPCPSTIEATQFVSVGHGVCSMQGSQNKEGTIYSILKEFCDVGPWNELYTEDEEDGVHVVCRAIPAIDLNGYLIQSDAPSPEYVDISDVDVISLNVTRSDSNVANYYWVSSPRFELCSQIYEQQFALQGADSNTVLLTDYPNSNEKLYGLRPMVTQSQQGGDDVAYMGSGLLAAQQNVRDTSMVNWVNTRRSILVDMNRDNVLYETGSMRVRGNEAIKAGMHVRLHRGTMVATYYVVKVDHDYLPFQGVFSTITFERGTGFIERVQRSGGADSPYLAEIMQTPVVA
jgi:hypothetical protein